MRLVPLLLSLCLLRATTAYGDGSIPVTCTGNGTDDTNAIATALNTVCNPTATAGGEVILPAKTCIVNPNLPGVPLNLCSNLTVRGAGPRSVLKVMDNSGTYVSIFSAPAALSNVVIRDFKVDQNPMGNSTNVAPEHLHVINVPANPGVSGITVSGMLFDPIDGIHAIHLESTSNLWATITNNYFNFNRVGATLYGNTAVFLEGSQQVVTGNTFFAPDLSQNAGTAIETHGGRSAISNNTTNNYSTLVNVVPTATTIAPALSPNDVVVANNSVTCAQTGITINGPASSAARTIQNLSITGNTIYVCNSDRWTALGTSFAISPASDTTAHLAATWTESTSATTSSQCKPSLSCTRTPSQRGAAGFSSTQ